MAEWQPIETAPKDGTRVMLWGPWAGEINGPDDEDTGPFIGCWTTGKSDFEGGDWWDLLGGDAYASWCRATHWMPLPEPPNA